MTDVYNLASKEKWPHAVYFCFPREAVMAAHAQSKGDFNTWDYEKKYGHLVEEGVGSVFCGDFAAWLDPSESNAERLARVKAVRASLSDSQ